MTDVEPTAPDMARRMFRAQKTAKIHEAFMHRLCFPHYKTLDPNIDGERVKADYIWIGSAPAFLPILFCTSHYRAFLATAYTEHDAHTWPAFHCKIEHGG